MVNTRFTISPRRKPKTKPSNKNGIGAAITFSSTPTSDWNCSDWVTWHKALVAAFMGGKFQSGIKYTQAKATELSNQVFRTWWEKLAGFFSYNKSFCGYESLFYSYMQSVGLGDILTILQNIIKPAINTVESTVQTASAVVENVADAAKKGSSVIKWVVPSLLVIGTVGLVAYGYNTYIKPKS